MSRFARNRRVFYVEEPLIGTLDLPRVHIKETIEGVQVIVPHLSCRQSPEERDRVVAALVNEVIEEEELTDYTLWYDSPKFLPLARDLHPLTVIYDCSDPEGERTRTERGELEQELLRKADLVFTDSAAALDGKSLSQANVHPFPSAVDYEHFLPSRFLIDEPSDQRRIQGPRIGLFANLDEGVDLDLIRVMAARKPSWQFVILGPLKGLEPHDLRIGSNVHYLGQKDYEDLPFYLSGWDLALAPFKVNEKIANFCPNMVGDALVAGLPVLSTLLPEILRRFGPDQLVAFGEGADAMLEIAERMMRGHFRSRIWWDRVDSILAERTWERTWGEMAGLEAEVCLRKRLALCPRRWPQAENSRALLQLI